MKIWSPTCYSEDENAIHNTINDIYEYFITEISFQDSTSLLTGNSGVCLFLYYYYQYSGEIEAKNIADSYIDVIIDSFENDTEHNLVEGSIGKAWLINHLTINNFIKTDKDIFEETDQDFFEIALKYLENNNYDLFYGALGIILFFISSKKTKYAKDLLNKLITIAKLNDKSLFWDTDSPKGNAIFFGLAHGQGSVYSIINKAITELNLQELKDHLFESISFTKTFININQDNLTSSVPNYITESENSCDLRLSWCNGDLGLFYKLLQIAMIHDDSDLKELSLSALLRTTKISTLEDAKIHDSIICHGTAGTALLYSHLYNMTSEKVFLNSAQYWWKETLDMKKHKDGCAGYKFSDPEFNYFKSNSLLQGVSGVGLALISSVSEIAPSWDECLLLS